MKLNNKYTYLIPLLLLLLVFSGNTYGQRIKGMAIAGGSLTQVEGDEIKGWSQFGFTGGLGAIVPFGKNNTWGFNIETLFSQKGSFQKKQFDDDSLTDEYRLRLNYIEIPLYFSYTDKDVLSFGAGGYWGYLVSSAEQEHSGYQKPYMDSVPFNVNDWGFLIDFKVRIWKHLHVNVRYSQSLGIIRERYYPPLYGAAAYTRKQYNQVLSLRAVYIINEGQRQTSPE